MDDTSVPASLVPFSFKPGQSGLPKNFRRLTDAIRHLVRIHGASSEEVVTRFKAARGRDLCGADHLAITAFTKRAIRKREAAMPRSGKFLIDWRDRL